MLGSGSSMDNCSRLYCYPVFHSEPLSRRTVNGNHNIALPMRAGPTHDSLSISRFWTGAVPAAEKDDSISCMIRSFLTFSISILHLNASFNVFFFMSYPVAEAKRKHFLSDGEFWVNWFADVPVGRCFHSRRCT